MVRTALSLVVLAGLLAPDRAPAQAPPVTLRVVGWNLESGESDDDLLASQVAKKAGVTAWGFSEVAGKATLDKLVAGANKAGGAYAGVLGTTGGNDRLAVVYDTARLKLLKTEELTFVQLGSKGQRAPLVAHFKGNATGQEFLFVVNHLSRDTGSTPLRVQQAKLLNKWVTTIPATKPVIMVGDFNFDYDVNQGDAGNRDKGFDELIRDGRFTWARPNKLVKTHTSTAHNGVLDFVFVGNVPFGWSVKARILNRENDQEATAAGNKTFKDSKAATDHRPVDAVFTFHPGTTGGAPLSPAAPEAAPAPLDPVEREALRREVEALRERLRMLEERLNPMKK